MSGLDKVKIKKSFSRAAGNYDGLASFQKKSGEALLAGLCADNGSPAAIVDIGTGTGALCLELARYYPGASVSAFDLARGMVRRADKKRVQDSARINFSQADAEYIPYKNNSFDLAVSNLVYQWIENLNCAFAEVKRVLKPGGRFYLTTLGDGSLGELYDCLCRVIGCEKKFVPAFVREADLTCLLKQAGFDKVDISCLNYREHYSDTRSFLKWLKRIGAAAALKMNSGLGGKKILTRLIECYESDYRDRRGIYATFNVLLAKGVKSGINT